jgi:ankyrin repeat protein
MIPSITNSEACSINPLGAKLSSMQRRELGLLCRIDSIGSEMRENVEIIIEIAEAKLKVIRELLSLNPENRDFTIAKRQFEILLEEIDTNNLECFQNLLVARSHCVEAGALVPLTKEKKQELILSFKNVIQRELGQVHLGIDTSTDLEQLERSTEEEVKKHWSIQSSLLNNKTLLSMEYEKTLMEKNTAKNQIDEIKSELYSMETIDIWHASEMGDLDFLKNEIKELWFWQVFDFVNQKNEDGQTMLALASAHGHLDCVNLLLDNKADPNIPDKYGYCPLHWSAKEGYIEITNELIQHGANVNTLGEYQRTPLNMAAYNGRVEVCELLLRKGADINARSVGDGNLTALHSAVMREHMLVIQTLIKTSQLDVNLLDSHNHSPLYYAIIAGCPDIAAFIVSHLSWKSPKDSNDPNHMSQLVKLTPSKNGEQISRFLSHYL